MDDCASLRGFELGSAVLRVLADCAGVVARCGSRGEAQVTFLVRLFAQMTTAPIVNFVEDPSRRQLSWPDRQPMFDSGPGYSGLPSHDLTERVMLAWPAPLP